ncbi:hypothetical protein NL676_012534 [Syzygium grande]|nr:hypothetical protein NL676_012534 [Syzygium grande]
MFVAVYLAGHGVVISSWSPKVWPEASSCLIFLAYGIPAVLLASLALFSDPLRDLNEVKKGNVERVRFSKDGSVLHFLAIM